jgi:ATP-dependent DNA helicase RecQ
MADFHDLEVALRTWPADIPVGAEFDQAIHRRLARALRSTREDPQSVGTGDLAVLVRQLLRHESLKRKHDVAIEVPVADGWPSTEEWQRFGVDVRLDLGLRYRIEAREWSPLWGGEGLTDALAVLGEQCAPAYPGLPADPVIKQDLQIDTFRSPGQAASLRAMSLLPSGQSLVVGLPTGSGKSLVFQAAAIRAGRDGQLTVVVVPTTALAMDQEARMQELMRESLPSQAAYPMAYHSGLSVEDKLAFRQRLKNGEQSIVIASPESVVGALRITLQMVAEEGRLAWFAIDEAHMVSQWGETFRPEFQFLAAFVASWRRAAPAGKALRTLLLTATLTDDSLETLRTLFAPDKLSGEECDGNGFHVIVAPDLRVEPDYWITAAPDTASRQQYVAEAIRHLPRPLIVYTAKRDDAEALAVSLRDDLNMRRVALFRGGDAATANGANDLKRWNAGDLDIVVATSAFGLGMDNSDVRAVIHSCVPETVDRFYQEVGRGGRDGRASLSLWVHTPADRNVAANLAQRRLIGLKRGWERWDAMRVNAERAEGQVEDAWSVRLDDKPANLWEENDANRAWNVRTLVLMARAGLISLGTAKLVLPEREDDESDANYEQRCHDVLSAVFGRVVVVEKTTITYAAWNQAIATAKDRAQTRDAGDRQRLEALIAMKKPFNEIFAEAYTLTFDDRQVSPMPFPGQCPLTRAQRAHVGLHREPADFAFTEGLLVELSRSVKLRELFPAKNHWITYVPPESTGRGRRAWTEKINKLLQRLVHSGIIEIALPETWEDKIDINRLVQVAKHRYVVIRRLGEMDPICLDGAPTEFPLPRVTFLPPDLTCGREVEGFLDLRRPVHVILLSEEVQDPDRPDRSFAATKSYDHLECLLERWSL